MAMDIPTWMLLGFAAWTVILLVSTIGVYRWSRILTGRAQIGIFSADGSGGEDWYRRSTRAHANCIENLPVFGAIVVALHASGVAGPAVDGLSILVLVTRILQSTVHVCFEQTNRAVSIRFLFFSVQIVSFLLLIVLIVRHFY
jgi:uncharacterized MAPEG superfamily protein